MAAVKHLSQSHSTLILIIRQGQEMRERQPVAKLCGKPVRAHFMAAAANSQHSTVDKDEHTLDQAEKTFDQARRPTECQQAPEGTEAAQNQEDQENDQDADRRHGHQQEQEDRDGCKDDAVNLGVPMKDMAGFVGQYPRRAPSDPPHSVCRG